MTNSTSRRNALEAMLHNIDTLAKSMPDGPYDEVGLPEYDPHDRIAEWRYYPCTENGFELDSEDHVSYFAALDPQVVRALVECARVIADWGTPGRTIADRAAYAEAHEDAYQRLGHIADQRSTP